jgi:hypothetical protein
VRTASHAKLFDHHRFQHGRRDDLERVTPGEQVPGQLAHAPGPEGDRHRAVRFRLDLLVAELRLRPLTNPMKMNGCAMVMIGASAAVERAAVEAGDWIAARLGEPGGRSRVWRT